MKVKTSELTDRALDWAVEKCVAMDAGMQSALGRFYNEDWPFEPSTAWAHGGPIIERELLELSPHFWTDVGWHWVAYVLGANNLDENHEQRGPTPLIAAMRCYVASKLGDEVEVPDELA